jgi:hypothetical protein
MVHTRNYRNHLKLNIHWQSRNCTDPPPSLPRKAQSKGSYCRFPRTRLVHTTGSERTRRKHACCPLSADSLIRFANWPLENECNGRNFTGKMRTDFVVGNGNSQRRLQAPSRDKNNLMNKSTAIGSVAHLRSEFTQ